jgi:hypothetical protein
MNANNKKTPTSRLAPHAKPRRAKNQTQASKPQQQTPVAEESKTQAVQVSQSTSMAEPVLAPKPQPVRSTLLGSFAKKNKYAFVTILAVSAILAAAAVVALL